MALCFHPQPWRLRLRLCRVRTTADCTPKVWTIPLKVDSHMRQNKRKKYITESFQLHFEKRHSRQSWLQSDNVLISYTYTHTHTLYRRQTRVSPTVFELTGIKETQWALRKRSKNTFPKTFLLLLLWCCSVLWCHDDVMASWSKGQWHQHIVNTADRTGILTENKVSPDWTRRVVTEEWEEELSLWHHQ